MDFETNLINSIGDEQSRLLLDEINHGKEVSGLFLNTKYIDKKTLLEFYPNLVENPLIPNSFYFDKKELELGKSLLFNIGAFYIQDPSSNMVINLLDPKEDEVILDMAAAPGGKTIGASLKMNDKGLIISNDISYKRSLETSKNVERMGLGNIIITCGDLEKEASNYKSRFDKIILDAPCSGSAMFRKNKEALLDWSYQKVLDCASIQSRLLHLASIFVRNGGIISYSTCSFSFEEDEKVILDFLSRHPDFEIIDAPIDDKSFYHHKDLPKSIRLLPHLYKGEGHFIALLRKKGEGKIIPFESKKEFKGKSEFLQYLDNSRSNILVQDTLYSATRPIKTSLDLIRYGVEVSSLGKIEIPSFHLGKFSKINNIELNIEQTKKYLAGETFQLDYPNGYHTVSYKRINLGLVKISSKTAKNHYPKGLRRNY